MRRWSLLGVRVGEATNPGPPSSVPQSTLHHFWSTPGSTPAADTPTQPELGDVLSITVANPTAILSKLHEVLELKSDLILMSETSAVASTQTTFAKQLRPHGYKAHWSAPVEPHHSSPGRPESRRGCAAGCVVIASLPSHASTEAFPEELWHTQRVAEATVRTGGFAFRTMAIYGYPANHSDSAVKNQELFSMALQRLATCKLPFLLGGDFNCDITSLPCWRGFEDLGCSELHALYKSCCGASLPATCKGATAWDSAILSPTMTKLWRSAKVDTESHLFDAHAPVTFQLQVSLLRPTAQRWRLPVSWADFAPPSALVDKHYIADSHRTVELLSLPLADAFERWGHSWEKAVHSALREAHIQDPVQHPVPGLGRQHRGRCRMRQKKTVPLVACSRPGRAGDFNPPWEAVTVVARQRTRQVRRLETYLRNLSSHLLRGSPATGQHTLVRQWQAICSAGGYAPNFVQWTLSVAHFQFFPMTSPALEWVRDLLGYVQFDCKAELQLQARRRNSLFKLRVQQDEAVGSKKGFESLRRQAHPPITSLPVCEEQPLSKSHDVRPGEAAYHCSCPAAFHFAHAVVDDGLSVEVKAVIPDPDVPGTQLLVVSFPDAAPDSCQLRQETAAVTPATLCRKFTESWFPIWNRDSRVDSTDVFRWTSFLQNLPAPPEVPDICLDLTDVAVWKKSAATLRAGRATGICGCAVSEIKSMPDPVLKDLVLLFNRVLDEGAFPVHLCRSTVSSVPKNEAPQSMFECRPITVFATIYRFFASTIVRLVLDRWSQWMPATIYGAMPGRSARDAALHLESEIEHALLTGQARLGFSVDLSRFFNLIPRAPVQFLLGMLGVPTSIVRVWSNFLQCNLRYPSVGGHLGAGVPSSTGVPEGCPFSILAQAAINWSLVQMMDFPHLLTLSYVDNWAWSAGTRVAFAQALQMVQAFCISLCLVVSWGKSYAWATATADRQWISTFTPSLLPVEASLSVVASTSDLGVAFRFKPRLGKQGAENRLRQGHERLAKLEVLPRSLPGKLLLLRQSVWPATFYGLESTVLAVPEVQKLRSKAAQALLGRRMTKSPHLTLSVLLEDVLDPDPLFLLHSFRVLMRAFRIQPNLNLQQGGSSRHAQPRRM